MLRSLRTPAASASRSSDRAIRRGATPASLARILSSSFKQIADQRPVLGQARAPRLAVGQSRPARAAWPSPSPRSAGRRCHWCASRADRPRIAAQVVLRLGRMERRVRSSVSSLTIRPAREVLGPRFGLAPAGERLQAAKHRGVAARQLQPLPRVFRREGEARRIGEPLHFLVQPAAAAGLLRARSSMRGKTVARWVTSAIA